MQILRTLGAYSGECSLFYYKRTPSGVYFEGPLNGNVDPTEFTITNDQWTAILSAVSRADKKTFRIRATKDRNAPVQQDLASIIKEQTGHTSPTVAAYVAAVLVNEGSLELYYGVLGPNANSFCCLSRDI